ncbi:TetR/AcrR family transcriptional regulator [Cryobacterium sp. TMT1-21]|uniref:TetR/AcrR family transcriptional regulator n=1 Tax=Cryobacterium shii TaxID=1259235 RepID=A0AAQ2C913_9MICO|nr:MULTISPECIES: TetR/AcrR family transcriptional regulator [Cryobacterium]TFC52165.1 TetR/AcrR family transcriptional regulator [Cryobacterium shii]TFC84718.1 TetR/AcrR family transcriptional regulator [Cryobacterium sp. TmT2-59]TFD14557.1 TetR/AcrR family transcriptional regulator [Cryobacterium sp. TMT4-10]TFD15708.1 TetR/AcrR family transcriptional regulator [Cryobacterium sp. TMT1-21]TFD19007.1 TetR/AcrR family transcriptional regulator [Cryobacterium sp. TMT2-23]
MSASLPPTVPRRRWTARQDELFGQLVALFLREGFAFVTLDDAASRLRCSKSTIYSLASSREQLVRTAVVHFFREAAERVEHKLAEIDDPTDRIAAYLRAVGDELRPASVAFIDDVAAFPPANEIYERNTEIAAARVRELISEGVKSGAFREVPAAFIAEAVSSVMVSIQKRRMSAGTGLSDAQAYDELAALIVNGIRAQ